MENRSCIQQSLDKIEAELASEISVNELAKKAGYSLFYYYHIFQKEVKMPVMQYIIRRRLLHGIYEMSQGEKKIDIALKYGFLTYAGFYKAFVREFSCTPAEYIASGRAKKPHPIKLAERKHCMMTHKKVSEIVKHWGLEKELVSDIFYEGNGERCENAFFIGDDFVLKFTSDFDEMQNHINLAKALENVGLLTAVSVKTNSGEEYVFDSGIYFYLTRRIKGKAVTAQSFYTDATTTNEESKVRFIGEILGQLSILLKDVQMQAKEINLSNDISEWILPKGKELFPEHALFLQKKLNELKEQNPQMMLKELFQSGMNVGRDMMGTMTNTLILAFTGGSINTLVFIFAYNYEYQQVINMYSVGIEIMQGLSSSLGVIMAVPVTSWIAAFLYSKNQK